MKTAFAWLVLIPVVIIGWLVAALDRLLGLSLAFPRDLRALERQKAWAQRALQSALPSGAQPVACRIAPLKANVAFRSNSGFLDLDYDEGGQRRTLECFVKFAPTAGSVWNRTVFNIQLNAIKEVLFNSRFLMVDRDVPAPRPYVARMAPFTGNLCLVTERMTGAVEHQEDLTELPAEHLQLALDGLATLHARYWSERSPRMGLVFPIGPQVVRWFDSLVRGRWSPATRTVLRESWSRMNRPQTVLHGDARVGNMMFPGTDGRGRFVLFDWQAVRKGHAAFDLAYFLLLSLPTAQRRAVEAASIDTYYQRLLAHGVGGFSREQLTNDYTHASLCVLVLLALPLLSGEASASPETVPVFVYGMGLWRARLKARFDDEPFDWEGVGAQYGLRPADVRAAVNEMLGVIERRLAGLDRAAR